MCKRRLRSFTIAALSLALAQTALAEEPVRHPLRPGADFCFNRSYDRQHLAAHPRQIIASLQVMGRNAWRATPNAGGGVYATLVARFRDTARPLVMHGRCFFSEPEDRESGKLNCKFFHDAMPDTLSQEPELEWPDADSMRFTAGGDWTVIRARKEPAGSYGEITTDDKVFVLRRSAPSTCPFPKGFWTAKGPTKKLIGFLP
jgi:hypothetical protein